MINDAWELIIALPSGALIMLFWLTILVDLPRYFIGLQLTAGLLLLERKRPKLPLINVPPVSVLLVGLNEEASVEACVRSLRAQTFNDFEIVAVSDGSTDRSVEILQRLKAEGLVDIVVGLNLRGGKPAGINLAAHLAHGEILIVVDCDCSFEPNAIEELIRPMLTDPTIGGVSGNILVRNWQQTVISSIQAIEYLVSISLGKSFSNIIDQVTTISGAFGAFRRDAWRAVGGMDSGGGEDFDYTMRLRLAHYKVVFTRAAICYTDVPETCLALLRQRSRWERDGFWLHIRKYRYLFNPFAANFNRYELIQQWDYVLFTIIPTVFFPFYLAWLLTRYGSYGVLLLACTLLVLTALDIFTFSAAVWITGQPRYWRLAPFLLVYGPFQSYLMRLHRLYAFISEWIWSTSLKDNYTPPKTRAWRDSAGKPLMVKAKKKPSQSLARRAYLVVLLIGAGWIGYQFLGSLIFLDADGLVLQDRKLVGAEYPSQVLAIDVNPGDYVAINQRLGALISTQMLDTISELTTKGAQHVARRQQIDARYATIAHILPSADARARDAESAFQAIKKAEQMGYSTPIKLAERSQLRYESAAEAGRLRGEAAALVSEREAIESTLDRINASLTAAQATYRNGVIVAPVAGTVGPKIASPGTVLRPGEPVAEVFHGESYAIAYLPTNRFYHSHPGDRVMVTDGRTWRYGEIERIEGLADALPPEYQSNFRSVERRQVIRVSFNDNSPAFSLLSKISVADVYAPTSLANLAFASWR